MNDRFRDDLQAALAPAYSLERELTPGGMSRVFVATERALSRRVAIKVLLPDLAAGLSKKRFAREIQLAASLQQANIVPVFATGEANGLPFYVMPLVDGQSLRHRLDEVERLAAGDAVAVLRDVARALAFAHERGVVHRDIKPENVLLSGATAVVTDFGIAKAITAARDSNAPVDETQTQAGMAVGTPAYMAPEQITADPNIDHRADIYSYGCLAYEVLSGAAPFASRAAHRQLHAHVSERPAELAEACPECPPALTRLVMKCLEKDPAARPASALEILRALETATTARNRVSRAWLRLPRGQRQSASAALVVLIVIAAGTGVRAWRRARVADSLAPTLAVLPFVNVGGDTTKDVWADGLTDDVSTVLAKGGGVHLATTASVDRYRGRRDVDVVSAGRALGVRHVLHGTVWPVGSRLRVAATLSDAGGTEVWRDSFDRDARDILGALDSIGLTIATAVHQRVEERGLNAAGLSRVSRGTSDSTAYELYLRGQVMLRARGPGVRRAAELFEAAIQHDPTFARAHSALSAALAVLPNFADSTTAELYPRATAAARRAIELDSTLGEPHTSLAVLHMGAYEWPQADSQFRLAMTRDSSDAFTYMHYGRFLIYTGRLREAAPAMRRARSLDPTSPVIGGWLAVAMWLAGQRDAAYREIDRALELDSTSVPIAFMGAQMAAFRGQRERARALAEVTWRPNGIPRPAPWPGSAAVVYATIGDRESIERVRQYVDSARLSRAFAHCARALLAMARRDTSAALTELERAHAAGELWPSAPILALPQVDFLRSQPRFAALLRRVGIDVALFTSPNGGRSE
jgi:TolB-like protein/tRNA A-37 threonylcarbamoyl transferase component Bud32/tetratricopeptide (TPR) repeat protein